MTCSTIATEIVANFATFFNFLVVISKMSHAEQVTLKSLLIKVAHWRKDLQKIFSTDVRFGKVTSDKVEAFYFHKV